MTAYAYSQNIFDKPHHYTYTPFDGMEFLKSYFSARQLCIQILSDSEKKNRILDRVKVQPSLDYEQAHNWLDSVRCTKEVPLADILKNLYSALIFENPRSEMDRKQFLDVFLKKYEVFKQLYAFYNGLTLRKIGAEPAALSCYIYLSMLCIISYVKCGSLKYLNCALKINDRLCGTIQQCKSDLSAPLLLSALQLETQEICSLMRKKGL
ncbi:MAG: hypothetical protein HYS98_00325 [Deltaproteobacteria bacterium]|nr:hypothetical protein [Deltaproteobacteria bacterium]